MINNKIILIEFDVFLVFNNKGRFSNGYGRIKRQFRCFPAVFEMSAGVVYVYDDELINACDSLPPVKKRVKMIFFKF